MKDRKKLLRAQTTWNGIDFVEVADAAQTELRVHFLNVLPDLAGHVTGAKITGGDAIPEVPVSPIDDASDWSVDADGRPVLALHVPWPGDFSRYTLTLIHDGSRLDPFFDQYVFSFKAGCPTTLDCKAKGPSCAPDTAEQPIIDYLAKDFPSFKRALFDLSATRFPEWRERSEADFGVMFMEALASLADDLSYLQDRVAAEASLETATERRSLVRHARLVDYEPGPVRSSRVVLRLTAKPGIDLMATVPPGVRVTADGTDGRTIDFETGTGLFDVSGGYPVRTAWNEILPHFWDDSERCLPRGATEMWVAGGGLMLGAGRKVLIETDAETPGDPPLRQIVTLAEAGVESVDPLPSPTPVTRLVFRPDDALLHERDLTKTRLAANLVPATQGRRVEVSFGVDIDGEESTFTRTGANGSTQYLRMLPEGPLAWLAPEGKAGALPAPEIHLERSDVAPAALWPWRRTMLDAGPFDEVFTVDPGAYRKTRSRPANDRISVDYDGSAGDTIRFGDGLFGQLPEQGTTFEATYRVSAGAGGNVAADSIVRIPPGTLLAAVANAVTNPFPATGGTDAETDESVRRLAPHAFRSKTYRAVRASDYQAAAETLPWVQRAGTVLRHTGSWLTVFTTADPKGAVATSTDQRLELIDLLDRYRLAGYESYVPEARYVSLDLQVVVCAEKGAHRGDVQEGVLDVLNPGPGPDGELGFFHPDRFTFGAPLDKSALEAAIQRVPGVSGVLGIWFRRRGYLPEYTPLPDQLALGRAEILRVDNNPSRPEHGSIRVNVGGGK